MSNTNKGMPKRGVSLYSYSNLFGVSMDLEDCFMDMQDMGATCIEILSSHIDNYPCPTTQWIDQWWRLVDKYNIEPGGYGHWCDTVMYKSRDCSTEEILNNLIRDFQLANLLGFKVMRTKLASGMDGRGPEQGWQDYIERALDYAEKYDVIMCPELAGSAKPDMPEPQAYFEFIEKTGTKRFGLTVDFEIFQKEFDLKYVQEHVVDMLKDLPPGFQNREYCTPEDFLVYMPYTYHCHGKFRNMDENFVESTMPYKEVIQLMVDNGWSGHIVSEYEGPKKSDQDHVHEQLRRQHVMLKRILGY